MPVFPNEATPIRQRRTLMTALLVAALMASLTFSSWAAISLVATTSEVTLANDVQKITFTKDGDGKFRPTTYVWNGSSWEALFDARRPLIGGDRFNLEPAAYSVLEDSESRKLVQFTGSTSSPANVWDIAVDVRAGSPLIWFQIASHFASSVTLNTPQPTVALWMNQSAVSLALDQGPPSPTGDVWGMGQGFGLPAAALWHQNKQAAIYFDMTPMKWFSSQGVNRFYDVQIKAASDGSQTGLGLRTLRLTGDTLASGEMLVTFYLYSRYETKCRDRFELLEDTLTAFADLAPSDPPVRPANTLDGSAVTWENFTARAISDFMIENVTYANISSVWDDTPANLIESNPSMIVHPDRAVDSVSAAQNAWTFGTVNHHLAPWILFSRIHPTEQRTAFAQAKKDALPRFYDSTAKMICSGTRRPSHVFGAEITWQSLSYYSDMLQAAQALAPGDYNPAITGRFLMGLTGLIQLAHNVGYVFPTYFNPVTHQGLVFQEDNGLGIVREPWSVGSYAYVLASAAQITGDQDYLQEAIDALSCLLYTMTYTASNDYFTQTYSDPMDMPVMEINTTAFGAVGAWKLYEQTGDTQWIKSSRDILNTLLRMTYWFDDRTSAVSQDLRHAGLFLPFAGAACSTAWETTEAHLCLAWLLGHDTQGPLTEWLLNFSNLNRINSFYFYPATYSANMRALNPSMGTDRGQYFPIEGLYSLESPYGSSGAYPEALYMAGNALWNWWMYEALGEASDDSIMVLNTASIDDHEQALTGADRRLIVYNPSTSVQSFSLLLKALPAGNYQLVTTSSAGVSSAAAYYNSTQLVSGVPLSLSGQDYVRVAITLDDDGAALSTIQTAATARDRIAYAYQLIQERAVTSGSDALTLELRGDFQEAMQSYEGENYPLADAQARAILVKLGVLPSTGASEWMLYE